MRIDCPVPSHLPQLKALWQQAFGDDDAFTAGFFERVYAPDRCRCVLEGETVAAAVYWLEAEYAARPYAYLYAVATRREFRRRGLCRALLEDTCALLARRGYAAALLMPGDPGLRRMYAAMGWRDCCGFREFTCEGGTPVALRQITGAEYGALREGLLPEDGVLQRGENLRYLDLYGGCWAGEGFAVAGVREGGRLWAMELLGDTSAAPGILGALGCGTGTFRTPGGDCPGVMLRALEAAGPVPGYFGLPFL